MNKQLTYYEFVGVLVPGVILLYFSEYVLSSKFDIQFFTLAEIGESIVFLVIAYGFGHILHALGNVFESFIWWAIKGKPTSWITRDQRFFKDLFDKTDTERILSKIKEHFEPIENKDYGMLVYSKVYASAKCERVDIFNSNYSLYRSLCVAFLLLLLETVIVGMWPGSLLLFILFILCYMRMIRFAKHYAKELYRIYLNL